jgi:hypothetical protein
LPDIFGSAGKPNGFVSSLTFPSYGGLFAFAVRFCNLFIRFFHSYRFLLGAIAKISAIMFNIFVLPKRRISFIIAIMKEAKINIAIREAVNEMVYFDEKKKDGIRNEINFRSQ